jgi:heat shock protein HslJ
MEKIYIIIFISLFCGSSCRKSIMNDSELIGTTWTLSAVYDTKTGNELTFPADASRKITVVFTDSLNMVAFTGICNAGTGTYSVLPDQQTLNVLNLGSTKIYCKYAEWETYTIQNLNSAFRYTIKGTTLTVYSTGDFNLTFISK